MRNTELIKRTLLLIAGLIFIGFGIALTKITELGVSPISSVPNVFSYKFPFFTIGEWLTVFNLLFIFAQIILLRKSFKLIDLLQIPISFIVGYFTDLGVLIFSYIPMDLYVVRLITIISGIAVLGFGISLTFIAKLVMNAGESLVKAISIVSKKEFSNVKIVFDISCVIISIILSLIFFNFNIVGTREGTIISAFLTGAFVKLFTRLLRKPLSIILEN